MARRAGYRLLEGRALTALAAAVLAAGDAAAAARLADEALAVHRETGHRLGEAWAHLVLAEADPPLAATHRAAAAEIRRAAGAA